jgi:site-specific recombinase XerD
VSPHRLRQAFATHLVEGGAQLGALQALLGHARLETTEIYTRVAAASVAREHRRTHPRA